MDKKILSVVFAGMLLIASGCSTVVWEGGGKKDVITSEPVTVHGSMYGFDWQGKKNVFFAKNKEDKLKNPIHRIKCHTNYLYLLTGALSLGFYYPQTFEYTLAVPEKFDDEDEESYDPFKKKKTGDKK